MGTRRTAPRFRVASLLALLLASATVTPATATGATFAVNVSWSGPVQVGDTITLTPVVSGVVEGTPTRCDMWIEGYDPPKNWVRMQVASDGCEPWTLTVPPSPLMTYTVAGRVMIGISNGEPVESVAAPDGALEIVDGGTSVPFTTNYPVQAWDLDHLISTPTPEFGEPFTIHPPAGADACQLRFLGGSESATVAQFDACVDWTVSIPQGHQQGPLNMFGETDDVQSIAWTGTSAYTDQRPEAALIGSKYGETYNTQLAAFTPGPTPDAPYATNVPAMFVGLDRTYTALEGDSTPWPWTPLVVGTSEGTCFYDVGLFDGESYSGPTSSPVGVDGCQDSIPVPGYLGSGNAVRSIYASIHDSQGRIIAKTGQSVGYVPAMDPVVVAAPPAADPGATVQVDSSTDIGVPASYTVTAALVTPAGPAPAGRPAAPATPVVIGSGYFDPSLSSIGDSITIGHAFSTAGTYRISTTFTDVRGSTSTGSTLINVGADTVAPKTTAPKQGFVSAGTVSSGLTPTRFTWSGSDAGTGVARYTAALSTDGGAYATLSSSLTSASLTRSLAAGHSYRVRVRAVDKAGNIGAWTYGTTFTISAYQETSTRFTWTGTWYHPYATSYWGSYERYATSSSSKVSFTFTGHTLAWIGGLGPTRGSAKIYVNGVYLKTVSLYASTASYRRIVAALSWSTAVSRKITILLSGTSGHPRVDLDAFVTGT